MKFNINQQDLQKSLNYCQGVIEKRSTLPILSNVLLDVQLNITLKRSNQMLIQFLIYVKKDLDMRSFS